MKWFSFSLKVVVLAVAAAVIGSLSVKETAAYPPAAGSVTLTGSSTTVSVGGSTKLTLALVNGAGSPVAGKACTMYLLDQPGTDASITQDSAITDAGGVITGTLQVGTTPGIVEVRVNCDNLSAALNVVAGAVAKPAPIPAQPAPIEPAQPAPIEGAQPAQLIMPATGIGPEAGGETSGLGLIIALLAGGSLTLAAGSVLSRRARRVRS
jgi:hypothetical protein